VLCDHVARCARSFGSIGLDVLAIEVGRLDEVPRARLPIRVPVVLSRDEVSRVLKQLTGNVILNT
jgi:hypothetical protein